MKNIILGDDLLQENEKIVNFYQTPVYYFSLAKRAIKDAKYLDALDYLRFAKKVNKTNPCYNKYEIEMKIGETYEKMSLFDKAHFEYAKLISTEVSEDAYKHLANCLLKMGRPDAAWDYLEQALKKYDMLSDDIFDELEDSDMLDEMSYFVDEEIKKHSKKFKLVDNNSVVVNDNYSDIIEYCKSLLHTDRDDYAIKLLEQIPQGSDSYKEAICMLAFIFYGKENVKKAKELIELLPIENDDDIIVLSTKILVFSAIKDYSSVYTLTEKLDSLDCQSPSHCLQIIGCMQQAENHELTYKYCRRMLKHVPYDVDILLLCALAAHNCGLVDESRELLVKAQKIEQDNLALDYCAKKNIKQPIKKMTYSFGLDYVPTLKILKELSLYAINGDEKKIREKKSELIWIFTCRETIDKKRNAKEILSHISTLIEFLLSKDEYWFDFFSTQLLNDDVLLPIKQEMFYRILFFKRSNRVQKKIAISHNYYAKIVPMGFPKQFNLESYTIVMTKAYYLLYSKIAFLEKDFEDDYKKFFLQCCKRCKMLPSIGVYIKDEYALAAVFARRMRLDKITKDFVSVGFFKTDKSCINEFSANEEEYNLYKFIFNKSDYIVERVGNIFDYEESDLRRFLLMLMKNRTKISFFPVEQYKAPYQTKEKFLLDIILEKTKQALAYVPQDIDEKKQPTFEVVKNKYYKKSLSTLLENKKILELDAMKKFGIDFALNQELELLRFINCNVSKYAAFIIMDSLEHFFIDNYELEVEEKRERYCTIRIFIAYLDLVDAFIKSNIKKDDVEIMPPMFMLDDYKKKFYKYKWECGFSDSTVLLDEENKYKSLSKMV